MDDDVTPNKDVTERALELAQMARGFIDHPYWVRMSRMLANSEAAELSTLLDPSQSNQHEMSRAAVAYIRKIQAMPFIDLKQGESAVKALEKQEARYGWNTFKGRKSPERN